MIYGWGINDADYVIRRCPIYQCWKHMIQRCHCLKYQTRRPTYVGCRVDERWRPFMTFRAWYLEQTRKPGDQLDKDFYGPSKLYSPETCCFVSQELNNLFTDHGAKRGLWPQGVSYHKRDNKFQAQLSRKGKLIQLGYFDTPIKASEAYLEAKNAHAEQLILENPYWSPRLVAAIRCKMTELNEQGDSFK